MRRILSIIVAAITMCISLSACAQKKVSNKSEKNMDKKVLVAYFSATGTTEGVAKKIAEVTGGELYKIQPEDEYSMADLDWTDSTSRCCKENNNPASRPAIVMNKKDLNQYDVVYLGYPNWWNMAPRIINAFIEAYDLKGKTVIPFMTSGGSGVSNSVKILKSDYPDINWQDGKLLNNASESDIKSWLNK